MSAFIWIAGAYVVLIAGAHGLNVFGRALLPFSNELRHQAALAAELLELWRAELREWWKLFVVRRE